MLHNQQELFPFTRMCDCMLFNGSLTNERRRLWMLYWFFPAGQDARGGSGSGGTPGNGSEARLSDCRHLRIG